MYVEIPPEGMDALSLPSIKDKSLENITKLFNQTDLPQTETLCIIYEAHEFDLVKKLINEFLCNHYQVVLGEVFKSNTLCVLFRKNSGIVYSAQNGEQRTTH
jgi:hypothetical protein